MKNMIINMIKKIIKKRSRSYDFKKVVKALGLSEKEVREIILTNKFFKGNDKFERVTDEDSMAFFRKNRRKQKGGKQGIIPFYDLNKNQLTNINLLSDFRPLNSFKSIEKGDYFLLCLCDS